MNNIDCSNYTNILYYTKECAGYVLTHKDLCKDGTIKNTYSATCIAPNTTSGNKLQIDSSISFSILGGLFLIIFAYLIFIKIRHFFLLKKKLNKLSIKFPEIDFSNQEFMISKMQSIFASLHDLLQSNSISLEVYKATDFIQILLTSSDEETLSIVKDYLTRIEGVSFEEIDEDPISEFKKPYIARHSLRDDFYAINLEEENFFEGLINILSSFGENEKGAVLFFIRSINIKRKIDKKIAKTKDSIELNLLSEKNSKNIFLVEIFTLGNSKKVSYELTSLIHSLNSKNVFITKKFNISKLSLIVKRFIKPQNLFINILRKSFGSFLNANELGLIFHPSRVERGKYKAEGTIVIEASPEFIEEQEDNILIGTSKLKNGLITNIYLPIENLARHVYLAGKTGVGKSTLFMNLFVSLNSKLKNSALIMLDPHGSDLIEIAKRIEDWSNLVYFNLSASTKTFTINPLFAFKTSTKEKDVRLEQIMSIMEEESIKRNRDLGTSIEKLMNFLILSAIHFPDAYFQFLTTKKKIGSEKAERLVFERQITLPDITHMLGGNKKFEMVLKEIFKDYKEDIGHRWNTSIDKYNTTQVVLDGLDNRMRYIIKDSLLPIFEGNKFNIVDIINSKKRVLMPLTVQSFGSQSRKIIMKFLLAELWFYAQSITDETKHQEVILFIDEFQNAQLDIVDTILSEARKYKIRLIFGNQYFGQLWENIKASVMGNVSTLFAFNIGNLKEAELITPLFKSKIKPENIASLPIYNAYLKTINAESNKETAFLSYKTIDFQSQYEEYHTFKELDDLNNKSLEEYGEDLEELKQKHLEKITDPEKYFLSNL